MRRTLAAIQHRLIPKAAVPPKKHVDTPLAVEFSGIHFKTEFSPQIANLAIDTSNDMMDDFELLYLAGSIQAAQLTGEDLIVEIGTYIGATAVFMHRVLTALGNTGTPILSIDPFERVAGDSFNPHGKYQSYLNNILQAGAETRCLPLVAFSQDAYKAVPDRICLLIVDGDHHYESVQRDLQLYGPKVRPGGLIFIDDYSEKGYPDVYKAVNEYIQNSPNLKMAYTNWFAIAQRMR